MAIGSKELATDQLETFDKDRLTEELRKAKEELFNLRFQNATGQLDNTARMGEIKKDIARLSTVVRERQIEAAEALAQAAQAESEEAQA